MSNYEDFTDDELAMMVQEFCEENPLYSSGDLTIHKRTRDSPNHYIYKEGHNVERERCGFILDLQDIMDHDHSACSDKRIGFYPSDRQRYSEERFKIFIACRNCGLVFGNRSNDNHITLVTLYKVSEYKIDKIPEISLMDREFTTIKEYIENKIKR